MNERLDILLLGASGFTGNQCIPYLFKLTNVNGKSLTWGIAGRSEQKLKKALEKVEKQIDANLQNIPIIIADINDEESLKKMAESAKLVINCCGPFRFLGERVVKACVAAGTHHIDITAEPQYMEKVQLEYDQIAKETGVYIVSACGVDCIPADMGTIFLQNEIEGTLNSVEIYIQVREEGGFTLEPTLTYNTWESIIHVLGNVQELRDIRTKLYPKRLPKFEPELKTRYMPHKCDVMHGWTILYPGSDRSVIRRSQRYFYEVDSKRPIQVETYCVPPSFLSFITLAVFMWIFTFLCKFRLPRELFLKYPGFFTLGMFSRKPPSEEKMQRIWCEFVLHGKGWKNGQPKNKENVPPCDTEIIARVKGRSGYAITCISAVISAIVVLTENYKIPGKGGVLTPGAAFAKTSLIDQLNENGITFEIISRKDV